jgi:hypothetical protein
VIRTQVANPPPGRKRLVVNIESTTDTNWLAQHQKEKEREKIREKSRERRRR